MTTSSDFGATLARFRVSRGISQYRLAELADCDMSHVCRLEGGSRHPSREMVWQLAQAMRLTVADETALYLAAGLAPDWMVGLSLDDLARMMTEVAA